MAELINSSYPKYNRVLSCMNKLVLALLFSTTAAMADVKPLPPSRWPQSVAEAVPHILGTLTTTQRSIISGTSKDSLFLFLGEWGEDVEVLLGLNSGNTSLVRASCGHPCSSDEAALKLMEAAWEALQR